MSSMVSVVSMVSMIVMLVLMVLPSIERESVYQRPLVPQAKSSLTCHQKTQE